VPRGEHAEPAPGVVKVRLQGDGESTAPLVGILREHAEILTGPDSYSGGRESLLVRVRPEPEMEAPGHVPQISG
jgi:hypothetical protein